MVGSTKNSLYINIGAVYKIYVVRGGLYYRLYSTVISKKKKKINKGILEGALSIAMRVNFVSISCYGTEKHTCHI